MTFGGQSMVAPLRRVVVKRPEEAFRSADRIEREWRALAFTGPPDLGRATEEHHALVARLEAAGAEVLTLPVSEATTLDSIYTHDAGLVTDAGAIVFQTGKPDRRGEGPALEAALASWGVPVLGRVDGEATAEGGDVLWLDRRTLVAGRGFRTNAAGVARLRALLEPLGVEVVEVHLPCANGPADLLHLQSLISLLDVDLAVVYRRLMPVPLLEMLQARGFVLLDVDDREFEGMACNVLALAPRRVLMLAGHPRVRARLEAAGCTVDEIDGEEIARKGGGGPTCLTRPLRRA
jgi:N-dimethylarginine dimethylaminohydrolase